MDAEPRWPGSLDLLPQLHRPFPAHLTLIASCTAWPSGSVLTLYDPAMRPRDMLPIGGATLTIASDGSCWLYHGGRLTSLVPGALDEIEQYDDPRVWGR